MRHGSAKIAGSGDSRCGNGSDQMGIPPPPPRCLGAFITRARSFRKGQAKEDHVRPAARPGELLWQPAAAPDPPRGGAAAAAHVQCAAEHALRRRRRPPGADPADEQAGQRRRPAPLGPRRPGPPQLRRSRLLLRQAGPLQPAAQGAAGAPRQQQRRPAPPPEAPAAAAAGVRRPPVPHVPRSTPQLPTTASIPVAAAVAPSGAGRGRVAVPGSGTPRCYLPGPGPGAPEHPRHVGPGAGPVPLSRDSAAAPARREASSSVGRVQSSRLCLPAQRPPRGPARDGERGCPAGHWSVFAVPAGSMCAGGSAATAGARPRAPSAASNVSSRAVGEGRGVGDAVGPEGTRLAAGEVVGAGIVCGQRGAG